jgi:hypothetical protein
VALGKKKKISPGYGQLLEEKDKGLLILPSEVVKQKLERSYGKKDFIKVINFTE